MVSTKNESRLSSVDMASKYPGKYVSFGAFPPRVNARRGTGAPEAIALATSSISTFGASVDDGLRIAEITSGCGGLESGKIISVVCFAISISFLEGDRPIDEVPDDSDGGGASVISGTTTVSVGCLNE